MEQRPAGGVGCVVNQGNRAGGQAGRVQRRFDGEAHDRTCRRQCVAADAENHGVAAAQDAAGVRQHVRSSLEDEGDDAERGTNHFDAESAVLDGFQNRAASGGCVDPTAQAGDHLFAHGIGDSQTGGGPATALGIFHVGSVDVRDLPPDVVALQRFGGVAVEGDDGFVGNAVHGGKGAVGRIDRCLGARCGGGGNVQEARYRIGH